MIHLWKGDGSDPLETMEGDAVVMLTAGDLRELLRTERGAGSADRTDRRRLFCHEVVTTVAAYYRTPIEDLRGPHRSRKLVRRRWVAMHLCDRFTDATTAEIGQAVGRHHVAVTHGLACMRQIIATDSGLILEIRTLSAQLNALMEEADDHMLEPSDEEPAK